MCSSDLSPVLDALAADGVRLTQFYNTGRCCPSRASILTGQYPHAVGLGHMTQDIGRPGYRGQVSADARTIAQVLEDAMDHPDVEELYARAAERDPRISIATVYRTVKLFEEAGILDRHDFGDGRSRYEAAPEAHHDHLIDVETGKVVEFVDPELEALQKQIAEKLGYRLVDHRMELYGVRLERDEK